MQKHNKFKLFRGVVSNSGFDSLFASVENFANEPNRSAKSIGVEYLEGSNELFVSLGYTESEGESNSIKLMLSPIGNLSENDSALEEKIYKTTLALNNIVCHAFYVNSKNELTMIFMCDI